VLLAAGAALAAVAGAAAVLAGAARLAAVAVVVAAVVVLAGVDDTAALLPLSWLQAASASRAAHKIGRRFNMEHLDMEHLERKGVKPKAPASGRRVIDQGEAAGGWLSAVCRPST
jgi:parvulin-like peptidyl-prolyl isomerase